jgi:hypothetical protein
MMTNYKQVTQVNDEHVSNEQVDEHVMNEQNHKERGDGRK